MTVIRLTPAPTTRAKRHGRGTVMELVEHPGVWVVVGTWRLVPGPNGYVREARFGADPTMTDPYELSPDRERGYLLMASDGKFKCTHIHWETQFTVLA